MPPKSTAKPVPAAQVKTEAPVAVQAETASPVQSEAVAQVETESVAVAETEAPVEAPAAALAEPAVAELTHRIAAVIEKGFYRAGRHWPREGIDVNRDSFDEAQWSALEGEPMLTVKPL
jgi:hypothetical protein